LEDGGAAEELEQATMVVTGGLGMGSQKAFDKLGELAKVLGASLGGSKQAVDRGWIAASRQVGLTGTTVAPKVYFAIAVSGALQHMAGCQKSKIIVAINKDSEAPIFRFARYGLVANWEDVVPELLARLPPNAHCRSCPEIDGACGATVTRVR
jgi:electron transfer flavoprotein alpha subunit